MRVIKLTNFIGNLGPFVSGLGIFLLILRRLLLKRIFFDVIKALLLKLFSVEIAFNFKVGLAVEMSVIMDVLSKVLLAHIAVPVGGVVMHLHVSFQHLF